MRLVWAVTPLIIFGIIGISESFAQSQGSSFPEAYSVYDVSYQIKKTGHDGELLSPTKQLEIIQDPRYVICNHEKILVVKGDSKVACVSETVAEKLTQRGWTAPQDAVRNIYMKISIDMDKETLVALLNEFDLEQIEKSAEKLSIKDQMLDCLTCFEDLEYETLQALLDDLIPDVCGRGMIYGGCILGIDGTRSYDPTGKSIIEYDWVQVPPMQTKNQLLTGQETWEEMKIILTENYPDNEKHKINLINSDSDFPVFIAPDVTESLLLGFMLNTKDDYTNEFAKRPSHVVFQIYDASDEYQIFRQYVAPKQSDDKDAYHLEQLILSLNHVCVQNPQSMETLWQNFPNYEKFKKSIIQESGEFPNYCKLDSEKKRHYVESFIESGQDS